MPPGGGKNPPGLCPGERLSISGKTKIMEELEEEKYPPGGESRGPPWDLYQDARFNPGIFPPLSAKDLKINLDTPNLVITPLGLPVYIHIFRILVIEDDFKLFNFLNAFNRKPNGNILLVAIDLNNRCSISNKWNLSLFRKSFLINLFIWK